MKKLMIAVAIVCAAAIAQAATITWSCSKVFAQGTQSGVSGDAYIFAATQPIGLEGATISLTTADIILALEGKGAAAVDTWIDNLTAVEFSGSNGAFSNTAVANAKDVTAIGATAGAANTLFILAFDTATISDSSKFYVASVDKSIGLNGNTVVAFGSQGSTTDFSGKSQVAGAWHAVNVPEPTSGLLLVLGMAGLALRRRRA